MIVPICACGTHMLELKDHPKLYVCTHCDSCSKDPTTCRQCKDFELGSRRKKLASWMPPKIA